MCCAVCFALIDQRPFDPRGVLDRLAESVVLCGAYCACLRGAVCCGVLLCVAAADIAIPAGGRGAAVHSRCGTRKEVSTGRRR